MSKEKPDYKSLLSSLSDDPFQDLTEGAAGPTSIDEASIFSVKHLKDEPKPVDASTTQDQNSPAPNVPTVSPEPKLEGAAQVFSINDPVLNEVIQHGIISAEEVSKHMEPSRVRQAGSQSWRMVLSIPGIPVERVFGIAARIHGIPTVDMQEIPRSMLVTALRSLPATFKSRCFELGLLPFAYEIDPKKRQIVLKMVTFDPLRSEIEIFLRGLKLKVLLFYAPASALNDTVRMLAAGRSAGSNASSEEK